MKKFTTLLLLFAFFIVGCSAPAAEEAAVEESVAEAETAESAETAAEPEEEMAEEEMAEEEMAEEEMAEEPAEMAEEEMVEEEMAEEAAVDESYPVPTEAPAPTEAYPTEGEEAMSEDAKPAAVPFAVDTTASSVAWYGFKPAGGDHNGVVNISEGVIEIVDDAFVNANFTLDMTSITNLDLSGGMKDRLEGHLKSDDFFGVETHPTATLVIKSAEPDGTGVYNAVADLTIKDITNEINFPILATVDGNQLDAKAEITIDRSLWDVRFGSGSFFDNLGDDLISNDIALTVAIVAMSP